MRVLVACEFSGTVRDAFIRAGHDAMSCDLLPTEVPGPHYTGDVRDILHGTHDGAWDLMIAHPPCTHLAVSGARWFKDKCAEQAEALEFVRLLLNAPIPRIALENPVSIISSRIRKPDQIIQPWMFGHGETKATCLWLKGLPKLTPTIQLRDAPIAYTGCRQAPIGGRNAAAHSQGSPQQWQANGNDHQRSRSARGGHGATRARMAGRPGAALTYSQEDV